MDFVEAIRKVYELDAVIKRKTKNYCIYQSNWLYENTISK